MTGTYEDAGEYNGKRYYELIGNGWFIWWDDVNAWRITTALGEEGASHWRRVSPNIQGDYMAWGEADGEATVTEI